MQSPQDQSAAPGCFVSTARVAFGDCDPANIVYFPNFYRWLDQATHDLCEAAGFELTVVRRDRQWVGFPLAEAGARFHRPATINDVLRIETRVKEWGPMMFMLEHRILLDGVLLDLDHFKRINDGFGHLIGDQVLRRVVAQVTAQLRATDHLGRYGGEEFLLLLGDCDDEAQAQQAAGRILAAIESCAWEDIAPGLKVTSSGGLAMARPEETVNQLLSRADHGLYEAKNAGRNRLCVC